MQLQDKDFWLHYDDAVQKFNQKIYDDRDVLRRYIGDMLPDAGHEETEKLGYYWELSEMANRVRITDPMRRNMEDAFFWKDEALKTDAYKDFLNNR